MKKIILAMTIIFMSFTTLHATNKHALKHANPMPNLMRIVVGNAALLNINEDQMKTLKVWIKQSKPEMKKMVKKVMEEEKMLLENALTADTDSIKKAETMLETRKNIISMKTKCRSTLKSILTKEQYAQVIAIYRSVQ